MRFSARRRSPFLKGGQGEGIVTEVTPNRDEYMTLAIEPLISYLNKA